MILTPRRLAAFVPGALLAGIGFYAGFGGLVSGAYRGAALGFLMSTLVVWRMTLHFKRQIVADEQPNQRL